MRVGLATCAALPSGDPDDAHLLGALERAGMSYEWIDWNTTESESLDTVIDLLVVRSPWDYPEKHASFLSWLGSIKVPVHNTPTVVAWNSNKRYLLDLNAAGVPVVPTQILESPDQPWDVPSDSEEIVIKPAIGVGSMGARRFRLSELTAAREHAAGLIRAGRPAMLQPYLPSVDAGSETALIHFDGVFSHSITKGPMLTDAGERPLVDDLYVMENIDYREASDSQRDVAQRALSAVPNAATLGPPLYARVDLVDDQAGDPVVLELELIEPSLFFSFDPEAADRFVEAISARA